VLQPITGQRLSEREIDRKLREVGSGGGKAIEVVLPVSANQPVEHVLSGRSSTRSITCHRLDGLKRQLAFGEYRTNDADSIDRCRKAQDRDRYEEQFDDRIGLAARIEKASYMKLQLRLGTPVCQ
jgi:hypothetical protein